MQTGFNMPKTPGSITAKNDSGHDLRMGGDDTKAKLLAHHGAGSIQPQGRECLPNPEFLAWHRAEVFKEPARE